MDKVVSLSRRRGFVFPSSEIYGGLGSSYDYGHYGVLLKDNVKARWLEAMVRERDDIVALEPEWRAFEETALATPYQAYGWVRPFVETVGAAQGLEYRYALLRDQSGSLVALLPLAITRKRGVSHGAFIGDKHSNYHMGLYAPGFASQLDAK